MSEHGTREFQVDQLLRNHKLVDLYKVVKQGLRISESSYSLKKVENFYMEKWEAEVVSAVESVIFYEKWKLTQDPAILDSIRNYNEDDCRSTSLLHTWLLSIKLAWWSAPGRLRRIGPGFSVQQKTAQCGPVPG